MCFCIPKTAIDSELHDKVERPGMVRTSSKQSNHIWMVYLDGEIDHFSYDGSDVDDGPESIFCFVMTC